MKYTTPVAELMALEAISVIMSSVVEDCDADGCGADGCGEYDTNCVDFGGGI